MGNFLRSVPKAACPVRSREEASETAPVFHGYSLTREFCIQIGPGTRDEVELVYDDECSSKLRALARFVSAYKAPGTVKNFN